MADERLLQVRLPLAFFERIDDWRHEHRYHTRTQAVRELLELGLAAKPKRRTRHAVGKEPTP